MIPAKHTRDYPRLLCGLKYWIQQISFSLVMAGRIRNCLWNHTVSHRRTVGWALHRRTSGNPARLRALSAAHTTRLKRMAVFRKTPLPAVDPSALVDKSKPEPPKQEDEKRGRCGRGGKPGCCPAKCAVCMVVAVPVLIVMSPLLIARRVIYGPMKCNCRRQSCNNDTVITGQAVAEQDKQPDEVKADKL